MTAEREDSMKLRFLKICYVVSAFVACFRFRVSAVYNTGAEYHSLDYSWQYAINRLFHEGRLWGSDVIFTYGPLGFMFNPIPFGNNVVIALAFWSAVSVLAALLFSYVMFSERMKKVNTRASNILLSFILFYAGNYLMGRLYPEYVLSFLILCLLSVCWHTGGLIPFLTASVLSVVSAFMKFNSGSMDFVSVAVFAVLMSIRKGREGLKFIAALFFAPAMFCVCCLLYNPSLHELAMYVRGAYEIAAGYISAMSRPVMPSALLVCMLSAFIGFLMLVMVLLLRAFAFTRTQQSVLYAMVFAVSTAVCFKHAFVMGQGHCFMFMPSVYVYCSVYVMFMDNELAASSGTKKFLCYAGAAVFFCTLAISAAGLNKFHLPDTVNFRNKKELNRLVSNILTNPLAEFHGNIASLGSADKVYDMRNLKLPEWVISTVSSDSAGFYPTELSLVHDLPGFVNMPVIQAYSAYTSWLDIQNAGFFADDDRAPKFIILRGLAFDNRFAVMDSPLACLEMLRNYSIRRKEDSYFLLERRPQPKNFTRREIASREVSRDSFIDIPKTAQHCLMKLEMPLSLMGKAAKLFWKIPEVRMEAELEGGLRITKRVIPEVLANDTLISSIVSDDETFGEIMDGRTDINRVKRIHFSGSGLKFFAPVIKLKFLELLQE